MLIEIILPRQVKPFGSNTIAARVRTLKQCGMGVSRLVMTVEGMRLFKSRSAVISARAGDYRPSPIAGALVWTAVISISKAQEIGPDWGLLDYIHQIPTAVISAANLLRSRDSLAPIESFVIVHWHGIGKGLDSLFRLKTPPRLVLPH